jgi:PAS domain-containing protein
VIATGQRVRNITAFSGPAGEERVYQYIFSPLLGLDGSLETVTCTARDITNRERLEMQLASSQERLHRFLAQAPVAIVVFRGRDFIVEFANENYQKLLPGRDLVGGPFAEVMPELGQEVWDVFNRVLETGKTFIANEWHIPYDSDRNGPLENHWFNVVYQPLRDVDSSISGFMAVLTASPGRFWRGRNWRG